MAEHKVEKWQASVRFKPGRYVGDSPYILIGPLRALECYIRSEDDRIASVTLEPHTIRS
jgi:hypothetical protein